MDPPRSDTHHRSWHVGRDHGIFDFDGATLVISKSLRLGPTLWMDIFRYDPSSPVRFQLDVSLPLTQTHLGPRQSLCVCGDTIAFQPMSSLNAGPVTVLMRSSGQWMASQAIPRPTDALSSEGFGQGMALTSDTLAIGLGVDPESPQDQTRHRGVSSCFIDWSARRANRISGRWRRSLRHRPLTHLGLGPPSQ